MPERRIVVHVPAVLWERDGETGRFTYETNYLIDINHGIIVDVEASTAVRQAEVTALDAATGTELWSNPQDAPAASPTPAASCSRPRP